MPAVSHIRVSDTGESSAEAGLSREGGYRNLVYFVCCNVLRDYPAAKRLGYTLVMRG